VHQRSVHARIHPSPCKSQRTVPRNDNMEHRVKLITGTFTTACIAHGYLCFERRVCVAMQGLG
ncbi:hypothetical protein NDU88_006585, partial [Pleurodeles waltl]